MISPSSELDAMFAMRCDSKCGALEL
ncbi:hypothetical protein JMJ77_0006493 [Colletotrichum scovillei]|uniref:Uncharacterized protein n=1 Tax=Colletotrichum scovillei TaxID=1209932 RepID=A0A9P7UJ82_9PEZI|nr:hypothetical protein JMJ77_0006493 [Colletotrichum scovillei]KAG7077732.1 hypothetical protein JMJ76_0014976 [Colletotrichum scovillei]KAG7084686.1 hypothetical protein JMJ78_0010119 [Colletotrichum scovillei]